MIGTTAILFWFGAGKVKIVWGLIFLGLLPLIGLCVWISWMAVRDGMLAFLIAISTIPITSLFTVFGLLFLLPGKRKLLVGIIVLMGAISMLLSIEVGTNFGPDAIIQQNAKVIALALIQYHSDYKLYPQTLKGLMPHYIENLREPSTTWGWVYRKTDDTFYIGYVSYVDRYGYLVCYWRLDSNTLKWDCLDPPNSTQLFDLGPTLMSPLIPSH